MYSKLNWGNINELFFSYPTCALRFGIEHKMESCNAMKNMHSHGRRAVGFFFSSFQINENTHWTSTYEMVVSSNSVDRH